MPVNKHGADYLTVTELAEKCEVHRNTVIYWINSGDIQAVRFGLAKKSPYYIHTDEANRIMKELGTSA